MDIGDEIRAARQRMDWDQRRLAREIGVSRGAVGKWEGGGGGSGITLDNLRKLSAVLGIPLARLLGEQSDEGLLISDRTEIAVVKLFRRLPAALQEVHLKLLQTNVKASEPAHQAGGPVNRRRVRPLG
jgi:transcriptional regulator with XRE-family HTH domain